MNAVLKAWYLPINGKIYCAKPCPVQAEQPMAHTRLLLRHTPWLLNCRGITATCSSWCVPPTAWALGPVNALLTPASWRVPPTARAQIIKQKAAPYKRNSVWHVPHVTQMLLGNPISNPETILRNIGYLQVEPQTWPHK